MRLGGRRPRIVVTARSVLRPSHDLRPVMEEFEAGGIEAMPLLTLRLGARIDRWLADICA